MESTERPRSHHIAEKLPAATYATSQEGREGREVEEKVEVGQEGELERNRTRSEGTEKTDEEESGTTAAIDFPDGGLRAWR